MIKDGRDGDRSDMSVVIHKAIVFLFRIFKIITVSTTAQENIDQYKPVLGLF